MAEYVTESENEGVDTTMDAWLRCMIPEDFSESFQQAADMVTIEVHTLKEEQQLELYGLFKQVKVGPCDTTCPGIFKPKERKKWMAWDAMKALSKEDAMMLYIMKVHQWLQWAPTLPERGELGEIILDPTVSPAHSSVSVDQETDRSTAGSANSNSDTEVLELGTCGCNGACSCATLDMAGVRLDLPKSGKRPRPGEKAVRSMLGNNVSTMALQEEEFAILESADLNRHPAFDWARDGELEELEAWACQTDNIHIQDNLGQTPLHWAVDRGHLNVVKMLLKYGADPLKMDSDGCTPVEYAETCEHQSICDLFRSLHL